MISPSGLSDSEQGFRSVSGRLNRGPCLHVERGPQKSTGSQNFFRRTSPAPEICDSVTIFVHIIAEFTDIKTWTKRLGYSRLRTFIDEHNHLWVEQNASKSSKWAKLARKGHEIAWGLDSPDRVYTGCLLIDGHVYTTAGGARRKPLSGFRIVIISLAGCFFLHVARSSSAHHSRFKSGRD
jgi:hypothetical protein